MAGDGQERDAADEWPFRGFRGLQSVIAGNQGASHDEMLDKFMSRIEADEKRWQQADGGDAKQPQPAGLGPQPDCTPRAYKSRPPDLEEANRRLAAWLDSRPSRTPSPPPSPAPPDPAALSEARSPTPFRTNQWERREVRAMKKLVEMGGRLCYPMGLFLKVSGDPRAYYDWLRPWQSEGHHKGRYLRWDVAENQLESWEDFRRWQAVARRKNVEGDERNGQRGERGDAQPAPPYLGTWDSEAYDEFLRTFWHHRDARSYTDVARRMLRHYHQEFERDFQLLQDPGRQDAVTTWLEYLVCETAMHNNTLAWTRRTFPRRVEAWDELQAAVRLMPLEAADMVGLGGLRTSAQRGADARAANARARKSYAALQKLSKVLWIAAEDGPVVSAPVREQLLSRMKARLEAAREEAGAAKERIDKTKEYLREGREYQISLRSVDNYRLRAAWIIDQIPAIEAEMAAAADSGREDGDRAEAAAEAAAESQGEAENQSDTAEVVPESRAAAAPAAPENQVEEGGAAAENEGEGAEAAPAPGGQGEEAGAAAENDELGLRPARIRRKRRREGREGRREDGPAAAAADGGPRRSKRHEGRPRKRYY